MVRARLAGGIRHLYVFGTAGEGYAVTDSQFHAITSAFADEMRRGGADPQSAPPPSAPAHPRRA